MRRGGAIVLKVANENGRQTFNRKTVYKFIKK